MYSSVYFQSIVARDFVCIDRIFQASEEARHFISCTIVPFNSIAKLCALCFKRDLQKERRERNVPFKKH